MLYCESCVCADYFKNRTMAHEHRISAASSLASNLKMATHVIFLYLVCFQLVTGQESREGPSLIHHLSNGMKFAQEFLGSESVALKVADFVVRAFQNDKHTTPKPNHRRPFDSNLQQNHQTHEDLSSEELNLNESKPDNELYEEPSQMSPLRNLVKLFGLQPSQLSAVAVNALVFVAQMISTFLAGPRRPTRPYRSDDPTTWILNKNSRKLQDLLSDAMNETLSDKIEELIKEQGTEDEISCIRLLVCKITPFINRMQKTVFGDEKPFNIDNEVKGSAILYHNLPTKEEINSRNDICEQKHRDCNINE